MAVSYGIYTLPMQATIYDGHTWQTCTPEEAQSALQNTNLSWIDVRLDSPGDQSGTAILTALGVDASTIEQALQSGTGSDFSITSSQVSGTAWLAGDNKSAPIAAQFVFDTRRLVTIRAGGDAAFAQVQKQLESRSGLAIDQPSRILGFVLQAMQITIQRSLADMSIELGVLDVEIMTTPLPNEDQSQELVSYRQIIQPFATRFPAYIVNVGAALLDPDTITVIDASGVKELQSFSTIASNTNEMLDNLAAAIRNAVQDLQGQISTWQGNRINQLTVVTIIFLPITFLTGYFGMNFQWIDNLIEGAAAYVILGVVLPIALLAGSIGWLMRRGFTVSLRPKGKASPQSRKH